MGSVMGCVSSCSGSGGRAALDDEPDPCEALAHTGDRAEPERPMASESTGYIRSDSFDRQSSQGRTLEEPCPPCSATEISSQPGRKALPISLASLSADLELSPVATRGPGSCSSWNCSTDAASALGPGLASSFASFASEASERSPPPTSAAQWSLAPEVSPESPPRHPLPQPTLLRTTLGSPGVASRNDLVLDSYVDFRKLVRSSSSVTDGPPPLPPPAEPPPDAVCCDDESAPGQNGVRGDPLREFMVHIAGPRTLAKLGIAVDSDLVILSVNEGALLSWCRSSVLTPDFHVGPGDRVAEVNGTPCADAKQLARGCKVAEMTLLITGPCRSCDRVLSKIAQGDQFLENPEWATPPTPSGPLAQAAAEPTTPQGGRGGRFGFFGAGLQQLGRRATASREPSREKIA